jgi:hypothetical protein
MSGALKCPICGSAAKPLDRVGDADRFECPKHDKFKVSGSAMQTKQTRDSREWESAFDRAKKRTDPGEWPLITIYEFDDPHH